MRIDLLKIDMPRWGKKTKAIEQIRNLEDSIL